MYEDKGIITEDEQILISRYPEDIQERLKEELLTAKEVVISSYSYDSWIESMEKGLKISFKENVIMRGELNTAKFARIFLQISVGKVFKPLKEELEHDGRLEEFKQYPKGTRVKANGEIVYCKSQ
ncbi:hypothetical protein [Pseudobacillus badius]|uniref:hypothetical protein n=1 Tax=Bacillus badius TaxID=1455 RepID=UPI0024A1B1FF|nr:hypothetical protein [Bacillus badius]GLY12502.1 hypothetical protein Bbad01_37180 [Bacillus badius]